MGRDLRGDGSIMKKIIMLYVMMAILLSLGCLLGRWLDHYLILSTENQGHSCAPPPEGFSDIDLVGTWIAGTPSQRDTLTIRADGTYKQSVHIEYATKPTVDFESDWQNWWLEYTDNNIVVLHLVGWRMCGYDLGIGCDVSGGSGIHMCEVNYEDNPGEGVLYVMGESEITLTLPLGLEDSWYYWKSP